MKIKETEDYKVQIEMSFEEYLQMKLQFEVLTRVISDGEKTKNGTWINFFAFHY